MKKTVWRCINRIDHGTKCCKQSPTIDEIRLHTAIVGALNTMMPEREFMMDTLKVMGEDKLLIIFKGGFEMEMGM